MVSIPNPVVCQLLPLIKAPNEVKDKKYQVDPSSSHAGSSQMKWENDTSLGPIGDFTIEMSHGK